MGGIKVKHKFRLHSIHAELELLAKEFDKALPPQKNDKAEYLSWYMETYPNAELWRALPIIEKNFLDKGLENPVRRKCAKMLGEIGAAAKKQAVLRKCMELLLLGSGDGNAHLSYESMNAIERMASAHRWQEFDFAITPLMERIVDAKHPHAHPNLVEAALEALGKIKPNKAECLGLAEELKRELIRKKGNVKVSPWSNHIRHIEMVKREWERLLIERRALLSDFQKGEFARVSWGNDSLGNSGNRAKHRRIIVP